MRKMIPLLLATQILSADPSSYTVQHLSSDLPKNSHIYFDLGTMYILPQLGVGFRQQNGYWGYDLGLKSSIVPLQIGCGPLVRSVFWLPWVSGGARLLYYPKPNLESQWYLGAGVSSSYLSTVAPSFAFGKSYQTAKNHDRFWQISAEIIPENAIPVISFSYGFCL